MSDLKHTSWLRVCVMVVFCVATCTSNHHKHSEHSHHHTAPSSTSNHQKKPPPSNGKALTPLSTPEECNRKCKDKEPPKTCYFNFTIEQYVTVGAACLDPSTSAECVQADGVDRTFVAANRMLPGPSIQVCEGDKVVIDVINKVPGEAVTIHWHGILQQGTQYYDGVPFVTQCPIHPGNTFRYQWYANAGTHFWHSHSGLQKLDGLHGTIVVRQTRSKDVSCSYYDVDSPDHVIELTDWIHECAIARFPGRYTNSTGGKINQEPDNLLINGLGKYTDPDNKFTTNASYAVINVKEGVRYRLRFVASLSTVCPVQLAIENHRMLVIAADGEPVRPVPVDTIILFSGERYDVVLTANQTACSYWIQLRAVGACSRDKVQQFAILQYEGASEKPESELPTYDEGLPAGVVLNPLASPCDGSDPTKICVSQLVNARAVDKELLKAKADFTLFVPVRFSQYSPQVLFKNNTYQPFLVNNKFLVLSLLDELSFSNPPSPLLSQRSDISPKQICTHDEHPARCNDTSKPCICTHIISVPCDVVVEICMLDYVPVPELSHSFHLHGYSFNVVGMGVFPSTDVTLEDMIAVLNMDRKKMFAKQSNRPPNKDTLPVPNGGYTIVRFRSRNPGYWFYHCHFLFHILTGMNLVLHVGKHSQLPPVPPNFPKCGNFLPPITPPNEKETYQCKSPYSSN